MNYSDSEFKAIRDKYGKFSTWAIWDHQFEKDTAIIDENINLLHSKYVLIGLNVSQAVGVWGNFRGGSHDRKIKYAFNSLQHIRGAYMTDLIKIVQTSSTKIATTFNCEHIIKEHVESFRNELESVKVTSKSKFIIFGSTARELYDEYYEKYFPDNKVFYLKHYSGYGDDRTWVEKVWERLNIDDKNFNEEKDKYKKHR
jgi:hypothetical protein